MPWNQRSWSASTYVGTGTGDGGDQYVGLDRFGRVVDQRWSKAGVDVERYQYGSDQDANVLYKDNMVSSGFGELYHVNGTSAGYDNLNRLTDYQCG